MRTSAAHLAVRAVLRPVLAWPLCRRGSLPLRAFVHFLWDFHFALGTVDVRNPPPTFSFLNRVCKTQRKFRRDERDGCPHAEAPVGPVARARCHHALSSVRESIDGVPRESFPGGYRPRCVRGDGERAPRPHRRSRKRRRRHPEPLVPSTREPMPKPRRASHADIELDARTMRPGDLPNR